MLKRRYLAALLVAGMLGNALAQNASVQQVPSRLDAATGVQTSNTSAATITIPGVAGQYIYVTGIEVANCAGATIVTGAAPTTLSSTNLNGATWMIGSGSSAAGQCTPPPNGTGAQQPPLKSSSSGTSVTLVLPTFATNQTLRVSAYYYYAP